MTVLQHVAGLLAALPSRACVAVDGVDASGKTTFADALARVSDRPVVRAGVDDFARPAADRYRLGRESPEGCYRDTTDVPRLRDELLVPFATGRPFRTLWFDLASDVPAPGPLRTAPDDAVLVVDGVFLQRPELAGSWDLVVLLEVSYDEVVRRAVHRDGTEAEALYRARYLPAHDLYRAEVDPAAGAAVVVDNEDPTRPVLLRLS